ncbi:palmdelphin [Scomber scombrus]|uniref:palmdelphin n=1 Tax=Scomber scombrus TaxID=13677 RepID=UPI002DDA73ED|nr:palmdelphin [Scomber scombrus]
MEEADLLKERLQAITDKRRIQEDIAKKRREIEEEKLKLQYIKKKALREQWLMDGLTQQSEEEQQAQKLQALDEQQQSDQLQSNIHRMEKEIEILEAQELNISANEEVILKRLKEVERTAEDIIKEINAGFNTDVTHYAPSPLQDVSSYIQLTPAKSSPICQPDSEEPKKATFAMEISVEHDRRTGKSQVVSTATITPETLQEKGLKVYDDGHKSVYALNQDGSKMHSGAVGEMTHTEVDELLRQATDKNVPSEVQYHQPLYSAPYTGTSRPSTPRTPNKTPRQTPTPSPSLFQRAISPRNGAQSQFGHELEGQKSLSKTPSPNLIQPDSMSRVQRHGEEMKQAYVHIPGQSKVDTPPIPQPCSPHFGAKTPQGLTKKKTDASNPNQASLVSVKATSDGMPAPIQPVYRDLDGLRPSPSSHKSELNPDALIENSIDLNSAESTTSLNPVKTLPEQSDSPVTMIFMGYENANDEEDEDIHAELVIIGNSDDEVDEAKYVEKENDEECLSFHPEGYKSKVFQPKMGIAKVTGCRDIIEDAYTNSDDLGLHKPTFIHKPGKHSPYLQGRDMDESTNTGSINMEKMKLCSTGR